MPSGVDTLSTTLLQQILWERLRLTSDQKSPSLFDNSALTKRCWQYPVLASWQGISGTCSSHNISDHATMGTTRVNPHIMPKNWVLSDRFNLIFPTRDHASISSVTCYQNVNLSNWQACIGSLAYVPSSERCSMWQHNTSRPNNASSDRTTYCKLLCKAQL